MADAKQINYWPFLGALTFYKLSSWYSGVIPHGVYKHFKYVIESLNFKLLPSAKYVFETGKVFEDLGESVLEYPEVAIGSPATFTLVGYAQNKLIMGNASSSVQYSLIKGHHKHGAKAFYLETKLPDTYEFIVFGWLNWDGKYWKFNPITATTVAGFGLKTLTPPFYYDVQKNLSSDFALQRDDNYGPIYEQTTGAISFLLSHPGIISSIDIEVDGTGIIRVELLPQAYNFIQTIEAKGYGIYNITPVIQESPTKANSGMLISIQGPMKLISLSIK